MKKTIPVHLIVGPLGIGKTTAIINYLKRIAGFEFAAVLVNDFGPVGLDDAIVENQTGMPTGFGKVVMVPGGCICCSALPGMISAFKRIFEFPVVDRIIIEPSGIAQPGAIIDLICDLKRSHNIELRPIIGLVSPTLVAKGALDNIPYYSRLVEAADILVANRCDLAKPGELEAFKTWAAGLYPPKQEILTTEHGQLPDRIFHIKHTNAMKILAPTQADTADAQAHELPHAGGILWPAGATFTMAKVHAALERWLQDGIAGQTVLRLKGILPTDEGWNLVEIAQNQIFIRPSEYRGGARLDWITPEPVAPAAVAKDLDVSLPIT